MTRRGRGPTRRIRTRLDESGALSVEFALVAPVLVLVLLLLVAGGRIALASTGVESAAAAAAREASLALTSAEAQTNATETASRNLTQSGYDCVTLSVSIDDAGLFTPLGETGTVTATVTCVLNLADIALPGLGGTRTLTATGESPVDSFRERV